MLTKRFYVWIVKIAGSYMLQETNTSIAPDNAFYGPYLRYHDAYHKLYTIHM